MKTILLILAFFYPSQDDLTAAKHDYMNTPVGNNHRLYVHGWKPQALRFYVDETESRDGIFIHLHPEGWWGLPFCPTIGYEQGLMIRVYLGRITMFYVDFADHSGRVYPVQCF